VVAASRTPPRASDCRAPPSLTPPPHPPLPPAPCRASRHAPRLVWPLYWIAQGTMFWSLFVVGHDCGHQSFSPSRALNDFVGNIVHASIMVPYHGWRVSHRKHHGVGARPGGGGGAGGAARDRLPDRRARCGAGGCAAPGGRRLSPGAPLINA
jgi:hypothetical protein